MRSAPGLVLMDINLPGINGIEATRRITAAHPGAVVMLLSTYQAGDLPSDAGSSGAVEYVHKEEFGPLSSATCGRASVTPRTGAPPASNSRCRAVWVRARADLRRRLLGWVAPAPDRHRRWGRHRGRRRGPSHRHRLRAVPRLVVTERRQHHREP